MRSSGCCPAATALRDTPARCSASSSPSGIAGADPAEAAELLLSELVTNAVRHSRAPHGRDIGVRLARYDGVLRVEVADAGPAVKLTPQVVADWDERGRGLAIVAALAERWGCCPRRHGIGKAVWAEIRWMQEAPAC